jgi:HEAT repeat protein
MENNTAIEPVADDSRIMKLIATLEAKDGIDRLHAREELEHMGARTGPYLARALGHHSDRVRWEAAKALRRIHDRRAAPALVNCLMDESFEVQWLAAEALIALGHEALVPLLKGLINNYGSVYFRQGAHHILHDLERKRELDPLTLRVLDELREIEPLEPYPVSAGRALVALQNRRTQAQVV